MLQIVGQKKNCVVAVVVVLAGFLAQKRVELQQLSVLALFALLVRARVQKASLERPRICFDCQ